MRGVLHKLSDSTIKSLPEGNHSDGGSLFLRVRKKGDVTFYFWNMRFKSPITQRMREMGLGPYPDVSRTSARKKASLYREQLRDNLDPLYERDKERKKDILISLKDASLKFIEKEKKAWTDPRMPGIYIRSLEKYIFPTLGSVPINKITLDDIHGVLDIFWEEKTETAKRVQNRLERIFDFSISKKWIDGENVARWRGPLSHLLANPSALIKSKKKHHYALLAKDLPFTIQNLDKLGGMSAMAVKFVIYTAGRSAEIRKANWSEIDLEKKMWVIPSHKTKSRKIHRIPISDGAMKILEQVKDLRGRDGTIFPNTKGKPLTDVPLSQALKRASNNDRATVHGLRSSFQDWARENKAASWHACEMSLAHEVKTSTEAAYFRGDLLEERRELMQVWSDFVTV